jgi:predicted metal-dependent HD superfamily phosphohydrolase
LAKGPAEGGGSQGLTGHLGELIHAYSSPDRYYHNLTHIQDCLSVFDQTSSLVAHPKEVELAIWFHDAVYDTRRSDNEQKSAEWAEAGTEVD